MLDSANLSLLDTGRYRGYFRGCYMESPLSTFFIDTEFFERPGKIDLISIGIVSEDGREYYAESKDAPYYEIEQDPWLSDHVLDAMTGGYAITRCGDYQYTRFDGKDWKTIPEMRQEILEFIGEEKPTFWSYYGAYDHVAFCWIFGRMIDLPKGWPMYSLDLKQYTKMIGSDIRLPKPEGEHSAIIDARWNRDLWKVLGSPSF